MLDLIYGYKLSVELFGLQYRAFLASARTSMFENSKMYNAGFISRLGFTSQEIKDLEYEIRLAIEERGNWIGSQETECIVNAHSELDRAFDEAGELIMAIARRMSDDLDILDEIAVYPRLHEIEILVYLFDVEILNIFAYFNPVTMMRTLVIMLESEVRTYGALFEYYVSEVYVEMQIYQMLVDDLSQQVFPQLNTISNDFATSANAIRISLASCHWLIDANKFQSSYYFLKSF